MIVFSVLDVALFESTSTKLKFNIYSFPILNGYDHNTLTYA